MFLPSATRTSTSTRDRANVLINNVVIEMSNFACRVIFARRNAQAVPRVVIIYSMPHTHCIYVAVASLRATLILARPCAPCSARFFRSTNKYSRTFATQMDPSPPRACFITTDQHKRISPVPRVYKKSRDSSIDLRNRSARDVTFLRETRQSPVGVEGKRALFASLIPLLR